MRFAVYFALIAFALAAQGDLTESHGAGVGVRDRTRGKAKIRGQARNKLRGTLTSDGICAQMQGSSYNNINGRTGCDGNRKITCSCSKSSSSSTSTSWLEERHSSNLRERVDNYLTGKTQDKELQSAVANSNDKWYSYSYSSGYYGGGGYYWYSGPGWYTTTTTTRSRDRFNCIYGAEETCEFGTVKACVNRKCLLSDQACGSKWATQVFKRCVDEEIGCDGSKSLCPMDDSILPSAYVSWADIMTSNAKINQALEKVEQDLRHFSEPMKDAKKYTDGPQRRKIWNNLKRFYCRMHIPECSLDKPTITSCENHCVIIADELRATSVHCESEEATSGCARLSLPSSCTVLCAQTRTGAPLDLGNGNGGSRSSSASGILGATAALCAANQLLR